MSPILTVWSQTRSARVKTGVEEMSSCRHNDTTKAPKTYLIRATTQDVQDKAYFNRKQSLCFLALVVLR